MKRKYEDEEEIVEVSKVDMTAGELQELISAKEDAEPKDKRKTSWSIWKKELNLLMKEFNDKFGKTYTLIK